jgi:hypothetical protein
MRAQTAHKLASRLAGHAFSEYVHHLFREWYGLRMEDVSEWFPYLPFRVVDTDFMSPPLSAMSGYQIYVPHALPIDLVADPRECRWITPELIHVIERTAKDYFVWPQLEKRLDLDGLGGEVLTGLYVLTNFGGLPEAEYEELLFPQLQETLEKLKLFDGVIHGIGSPDSFFETDPATATRVLETYLASRSDGICISVYPERRSEVGLFTSERHLSAGVSCQTHCPCEPVVKLARTTDVLREFQENLHKDLSEVEWEAFLKEHFRDIFGPRYDRVETQIWLRLPDIDQATKPRRLDILLRNSVASDWELVELKRPVKIIRSYRDIPVLTAEVQNAIQQVQYYDRMLRSDDVRRQFAKEGIEYYEPELKVIIGRRPAIPLRDWRWVIESCRGNVKVITYDDLIAEMKARLSLLTA